MFTSETSRPSRLGGLAAAALLVTSLAGAAPAAAQNADEYRVRVQIENLAPERATFQTPFWVGFHDGFFDIYDRNLPANQFFSNDALERLAEDGSTGPIADAFASEVPSGVDATLPGPNGPIAPGDVATGSFLLDSSVPQFFSYASMVIPSNDFFVANGNPQAHQIFDDAGNFIARDFILTGSDVLDAGTEVNDELPANTAFFGQAAPDTGVVEGGVVIGVAEGLTGFRPVADAGILASPRFAAGDFLARGYPVARISFTAAPAFTENANFVANLSGQQQVPPVASEGRGRTFVRLRSEGTRLILNAEIGGLRGVTAAHLHLGAAGTNGPVVVSLDEGLTTGTRRSTRIRSTLTAEDLTGPLTALPLDALVGEIAAGNIYLNIHTEANPAGEIRGQLQILN